MIITLLNCHLVKPLIITSPEGTIFNYLKGMFIMICVNIIPRIVLNPIEIFCLIMLLMLINSIGLFENSLEFLIDSGVIKHVHFIIKPT